MKPINQLFFLKKRWLITLFICYCWTVTSIAQDLSYQQFTIENGLPSNQVYDVYQDKQGFIWFATENGLSRYDGETFVNYTIFDGLPDTEILGFYEDSRGRVWFRTLNGKIGYYQDGVFYSDANTPFLKGVFLDKMIHDIIESGNGNMYFYGSLVALEIQANNQATKWNVPNGVSGRQLAKDTTGTVYLIGNRNKPTLVRLPTFERTSLDINLFDSTNLLKFVAIDYLQVSELLGDTTQDLQESHMSNYLLTPDHKVWIISINKPLQLFDYQSKKLKLLHKIPNLNTTKGILAKDGTMWVGSLGNGVFKFNPVTVTAYKIGQHLKGNLLASFYLNHQNKHIYCGTNDGYLNIITADTIQAIRIKTEGSIPRIRDIQVGHQQDIWLVHDEDLEVIHPSTLTQQSIKYIDFFKGAPKAICISDSINLVFLATGYGIYKTYAEQSNIINTQRLSYQRATTAHIDSKQTVWIGTPKGLYFAPNYGENEPTKSPNIDDPITCINHMKETILVGTKGKGLLMIKGDSIQRWTTQTGLPSNLIRSIQIDAAQQNIWLATNQGLCKMDLTQRPPTLTTLTKENGLMSNNVLDCGILDSVLYVLSAHGISKLKLSGIDAHVYSPRIALNNIFVNDKKMASDSLLTLSHDENNIQFQYSGIHFGNRQHLNYIYKLHTYHDDWQKTQNTTLLFEQLAPGRYSLELYASIQGKKSIRPEIINFEIIPAFYQRTEIQFLGVLFLSCLILYMTRLVIGREKKKNKAEKRLLQLEQLALQSQMNPHFIKNSLGAIQHLMIKKDVRTANKYLTVFGELITKLLKQADQSQIKVIDEINILELYLSIEKLRFDNNFEYTLTYHINEILDEKIPAMMIQPLVENAIIHGFRNRTTHKNNQLNIELHRQHHYIICVVEDNGSGIPFQNTKQHHILNKKGIAMKNIQERIALLAIKNPKTDFKIIKTNNSGTLIQLCLPLTQSYD